MNVRRKSFIPGFVFFIFVSASKAIQILKNLPHPNPTNRIQTFEKQVIIQNLTEDKVLSKSNESQLS
jgi:hypothetical protein